MAIQYTWSIINLQVSESLGDFSDVITTIVSKCKAEETRDGVLHAYEENFFTSTDTSNLTTEFFTEYANLTEANILAWVYSIESKSDIESHVGGAISNTGTQPDPVEKALPWA